MREDSFGSRRAPIHLLALLVLLLSALAPPVAAQHGHAPERDPSRPDPRTLTAEQWQSDLAFLAEAIRERHPQPFHTVSEEAFEAAVARLDARIPELSYAQILVELSRLVAMLGAGDGHSRVRFEPPFVSGAYPVRFWIFADGLFLRSAAPEHAALAGRRVLGLGGVPVDEALDRLAAIVPGDNEFDRRFKMAMHLMAPEVLEGLGLADAEGGLELELEGDGGAVETVRLEPAPWPEDVRWDDLHLGAPESWVDLRPADVAVPRALQRLDEWYWMEPLAGGKVFYVQLNAIGNQDERPTMAAFFAEIFERAEDEKVEKLVLDVRYNGGGNNLFNRAVVHGLIRSDKMNRRGRTYVLIGRGTFSAAQNLVTRLARETEAVFVGEPSGGKPNHYGDARRVTLPASGLDVSISTLYWQDGGPFDEGPWQAPDFAVDLAAADWAAGRDPVIEKALALDPAEVGRPFTEMLVGTFQSEGLDAALAAYAKFKADPAHRYVDTDGAMNRAGYYLLQNGQVEGAIRVFRLNVEAYPERWNPWDSLGEALAEAGRVEESIAAYERSLALNPENEGGARMLAKLHAYARAHGASPPER